ncbi:unnamed protein product, partial [Didymodactylos carnosus]
DPNKCIDYITNLSLSEAENKVLLLIIPPETLDTLDTFIQLSKELSQINSIYLLISDYTTDDAETVFKPSSSTKICEVYTNIRPLCNQLKQMSNVQRQRKLGERGITRDDDFTLSTIARSADSALPTTDATTTQEPLTPTTPTTPSSTAAKR